MLAKWSALERLESKQTNQSATYLETETDLPIRDAPDTETEQSNRDGPDDNMYQAHLFLFAQHKRLVDLLVDYDVQTVICLFVHFGTGQVLLLAPPLAKADIVASLQLASHIQITVRRVAKDDRQVEKDYGDQCCLGREVNGRDRNEIQYGEHACVDYRSHCDGNHDLFHCLHKVALGVCTLLLERKEDNVHIIDA